MRSLIERGLEKAGERTKYKPPSVDQNIKCFLKDEFEKSLYEKKERGGFLILNGDSNFFTGKIPCEQLIKNSLIEYRDENTIIFDKNFIRKIASINDNSRNFKFIPYHTHLCDTEIEKRPSEGKHGKYISYEEATEPRETDFSALREIGAPYMIIIDPNVVKNDKIYIVGLGMSDFDSKLH